MRKSLLGVIFAFVLFTACEETETTTVDITGTATITGTVFANTDQTDDQSQSEILVGVPVRIFWNTEDLDVYDDGEDDRTVSIIVTTDSAGIYTAEVPTTEDGVSFDIEFDEIELDVTYSTGSGNATESVVFNSGTATAFLRIGETVTEDFDYESNFKSGTILEKFATIFGTVVADTEQINTEGIPEDASGATVTVEWEDGDGNERSVSTTTDASGSYSVQVPTEDVEDGEYTVVFEEFETGVDYNDGFRDVTGFTAVFNEGDEDVDGLEAGDSEEVNYSYTDDLKDALPIFARIEGNIEVRVNNIFGEEDENPVAGLIIRFFWDDEDGIQRGATATTAANGDYSIEVPITFDNTIEVTIPEIVIDDYEFNNGSDDVVGTATYNEVNTTRSLSKGQEDTFDISDTTPSNVEEN